MRVNPNDWYMILLNDEPLIPEHIDSIMDYWTAETVLEFVRLIDPSKELIIQKVSLIDTEQASSEVAHGWFNNGLLKEE